MKTLKTACWIAGSNPSFSSDLFPFNQNNVVQSCANCPKNVCWTAGSNPSFSSGLSPWHHHNVVLSRTNCIQARQIHFFLHESWLLFYSIWMLKACNQAFHPGGYCACLNWIQWADNQHSRVLSEVRMTLD